MYSNDVCVCVCVCVYGSRDTALDFNEIFPNVYRSYIPIYYNVNVYNQYAPMTVNLIF